MRQTFRICLANTRMGFAGGERWFLWAAHELSARGNEVTLLASSGSEMAARGKDRSFHLVTVGQLVPTTLTMWRVFRDFRPDVVLCNTGKEVRAAVLSVGLNRRCRIVLRRGLCKGLAGGRLRHLFYRRVDHFICNSRATAEVVARSAPWIDGNRIVCLYNPAPQLGEPEPAAVQRMKYRLGIEAGDFVVVSVGRLDPDKGHSYLIEAYSQLYECSDNTKLIIAGEGKDRPILDALARKLGVIDRVVLCGFLNDVAPLYRIADILVQPSLPGYESFSNAALEAMSYGIPIVATRSGGFAELITERETGMLVPSHDSNALASALIELWKEPALRRSIGSAGRSMVARKFGAHEKAEELARFLGDVVTRGKETSASNKGRPSE